VPLRRVESRRMETIDPELIRKAEELRKRAAQLHDLVKGGIWRGKKRGLMDLTRAVYKAHDAAMPHWRPAVLQQQVVTPIAVAGANLAEGNQTLEWWVDHVARAIRQVCTDPAAMPSKPGIVAKDTIRRAIEACAHPRPRGAPRRGATGSKRDEAVHAVLKELGVAGATTSEAVRKLIEKSVPAASPRNRAALREHLASARR
jgi:hypothetical protein